LEQKLRKKAILITLIVSALMSATKFGAYFFTSSNAIFTDAAESIINIVASAFAFYSIHLAAKPKDQNHPYGHGKIEFFAVGFEGALIISAGVAILVKSIFAWFTRPDLENLLAGSLLIGLTGLVNLIMARYLINISRKTQSITLHAEGKHLVSDVVSSFGIVTGLLIIHFTKFILLDILISLAVGLFMLYNGYKLTRKSVAGLMDEADTHTVEELIATLNLNRRDNWIDVHNMRVQKYGENLHVDCHLTLPYYFDIKQMSEEVADIELYVNSESSADVELFVQVDPCLPQFCHFCRKKDCLVRSADKTIDLMWTIERLVSHVNHFDEAELEKTELNQHRKIYKI